jgi:hypothetical protein
MSDVPADIRTHPIHLGRGATAVSEPEFTGETTLHQEQADGTTDDVTLRDGEYAVNAPGVWHTADVAGEATALFITAGMGTEHRPR